MTEQKKQPKLYNEFWFLYSLILFPILTVIMLVNYLLAWQQTRNIYEEIYQQHKAALQAQVEIIDSHMHSIVDDIIFWSQQNELAQIGINPNARQLIANEYFHFLRLNKKYDQIRLIGINGEELVRVNYRKEPPQIIPHSQLQNKSQRYYVKQTLHGKKGHIYISPFDLNVEHGSVVVPYNPTIRFSTPIFIQNELIGMIVLNYRGEYLLNALLNQSISLQAQLMLVNQQGYWFIGPSKEDEWGFMFEDKKNRSFKNTFPYEWNQIIQQESGNILSNAGIFSFQKVSPHTIALHHSILEHKEKKHDIVTNKNNDWYIVFYTDDRTIALQVASFHSKLFLAIISLAILIASIVYLSLKNYLHRKRSKDILYSKANFDAVTGLPNRNQLIELANKAFGEAQQSQNMIALLFIDLDGFKAVNDTYGHETGDWLLHEAAHRMQNSVRRSDIVSRLAGDEFVIILTDILDEDDVVVIANKICNHLSQPFIKTEIECSVSASIGIAFYPEHANNVEALIACADSAMYQAKNKGKSGFWIVDKC